MFSKSPTCWIAIAMISCSAFFGSFTQKLFWHQQTSLRNIRILKGSPKFRVLILLLVFASKLRQETIELSSWHSLNFNGRSVGELCISVSSGWNGRCYWKMSKHRTSGRFSDTGAKLSFLLELSMNSLYCENECFRLQLTILTLLENLTEMYTDAHQQTINRIFLLEYW